VLAGRGRGQAQRGRRLFFTARGRWSSEGWSSCGSCHPDGLTDNITWIFAAGPRQSTSMDGSFSHGPGAQKQRIFNWTAIIDEMHDFEGNTRGTQGGKGAITTAAAQADCGDLTKETPAVLAANNLATPTAKEVQDAAGMVRCVKDFDDIDDSVDDFDNDYLNLEDAEDVEDVDDVEDVEDKEEEEEGVN